MSSVALARVFFLSQKCVSIVYEELCTKIVWRSRFKGHNIKVYYRIQLYIQAFLALVNFSRFGVHVRY